MANYGADSCEVFSLSGYLWERPIDVASALEDPRLSDCFLFDFHEYYILHLTQKIGSKYWEQKYKIVNGKLLTVLEEEDDDSKNNIDYTSSVLFDAKVHRSSDGEQQSGAAAGPSTSVDLPAHVFFHKESEWPPREMLHSFTTVGVTAGGDPNYQQLVGEIAGDLLVWDEEGVGPELLAKADLQRLRPDCLLKGLYWFMPERHWLERAKRERVPVLLKRLRREPLDLERLRRDMERKRLDLEWERLDLGRLEGLEWRGRMELGRLKQLERLELLERERELERERLERLERERELERVEQERLERVERERELERVEQELGLHKRTSLGLNFASRRICEFAERLVEVVVVHESSNITQLKVKLQGAVLGPNIERALRHPRCRLSRLDLRTPWLVPTTDDKILASLLQLGLPATVSDLGVDICSSHDLQLLLNSDKSFAQLLILRLQILSPSKGEDLPQLNLLVQHLNCNIRFLDLSFDRELGSRFWRSLQQNNSSNKANPLQALRISIPPPCVLQVVGEGGLADYLRSPHCSLLWLRCRSHGLLVDSLMSEKEEMELVDSLAGNFSLCTLPLDSWRSPAAKAQAKSFIRRNVLYKSGQLLKEPHINPTMAKLFLCGHGEAGKTTLCRSLLATASISSSLRQAAAASSLRHSRGPRRTRGMEFHPLLFNQLGNGIRSKLLICDLAGQHEYHVFHHYFMHASNDDLFVVVCKLPTKAQEQFERELRYWLKFIVSHRSRAGRSYSSALNILQYKPKVIVVVNFFYRESLEKMLGMARDKAHSVMEDFSGELNFGRRSTTGGQYYENLYGIAANKVAQVQAVKTRLGALLHELLGANGRFIPKLCSDIAEKVLPSLIVETKVFPGSLRGGKSKRPELFLPYRAILHKYCEMFPHNQENISKRFPAALMELHNQGALLFFPRKGTETSTQLVITDSSWFCHNLIGELLAVYLEERWEPAATKYSRAVWRIEDVKDLLRKQECKEEHLEELVRYLQDLELCFLLDDTISSNVHARASNKKNLLFPALLKDTCIEYPNVVLGSSSESQEMFFGRRLQCGESSVHLIPAGVFSRLQVRLHKVCSKYGCYKLGYCWASFMQGSVGAMVRFGGDVSEPWENKQWIDILVFYPNEDQDVEAETSNNSRFMTAAENLMCQIKELIYDICQSEAGIPTVMLQEWVLQSKRSGSAAVKLAVIKEDVTRKGLDVVNWSSIHIPATPAVELLLPTELEEQVSSQLTALARIRAEFSFSNYNVDDAAGRSEKCLDGEKDFGKLALAETEDIDGTAGTLSCFGDESHQLSNNIELRLQSFFKQELERLDRRQKERFANLHLEMHNMSSVLQLIRKDTQSLRKCLRQTERAIISNCSTRLLRHELTKERAHPLYPYLVDAESGKLGPLKALLLKKARLHFLCESLNEGPHVVEGQRGKEVTIEVKKWLTKAARVMLPAFRVICCLARIGTTVYLPGAQVFIPSPDCLVDGLGFTQDALQHEIFPRALEALLDAVPDVDPKHLLTHEHGSMLNTNEIKEAMQVLLKHENIDMHSDFSLQRVAFSEKVCWVCEKHMVGGTQLETPSNPFKTTT